ncbi:hypothetical protein HHX48_14025 [Salinimonas sp. HHU 13199]|uniref:Energy transducer TonB n=1 Tax=Salinimonas profundi TaxID=2729140 RepID=A0ABR8LKZ0_9ALTE|nr:hypothetical protein [Salinimonas profundi]MBD3586859.1 hypothetical protein [Salinimonas profundi]
MDIQWDRIDIPEDADDKKAGSTAWIATNDRLLTFAIAFVLHGIIVISAALFVTLPTSEKTQSVSQPVRARLVVAPPAVRDSVQPEPIKVDPKTPAEKIVTEQNKTPNTDKRLDNAPDADNLPEKTLSKPEPTPPPSSPTSSVSTSNVHQRGTSVSSAAALNNYFSQHNESQISELGKTESRQARHQQRHPSLTDARKGAPEKDKSAPKIRRLRCDRVAGEVVATLSTITGGTLRCSSEAQLAPHINKRLEEAGAKR